MNLLPQFSKAETYQIHSSSLDNLPGTSKCRNQFHLYNLHHSDMDLSCTGPHLQKQFFGKTSSNSSFLLEHMFCELPQSRYNSLNAI